VTTQASVLEVRCVVPSVKGRTLRASKTRIRRAHCTGRKDRYKASTIGKKNRVLAQKPRRGRKLRKGARVNLTVGNGPGTSPVPPPPPARPASVFLSPPGSDGSPCTRSSPCRSFDRADQVAQLGQTVELAGGSYGDQTMHASAKGSGAVIVFRPAAGKSVKVGSLTLNNQKYANSFWGAGWTNRRRGPEQVVRPVEGRLEQDGLAAETELEAVDAPEVLDVLAPEQRVRQAARDAVEMGAAGRFGNEFVPRVFCDPSRRIPTCRGRGASTDED
jgi:hypothetical protein